MIRLKNAILKYPIKEEEDELELKKIVMLRTKEEPEKINVLAN